MPQLVKKQRSGWAVLAVGAVIASILAVGASPAVATVHEPDAEAKWTACLGPATEDHGFTDIAVASVHYQNINCLAYYKITKGRTADSFDPGSHVTRSQMALFLTRAARAAGIDLGDAMDEGFTDLDMVSAERSIAINQLAAKGIMEGRTATTFEPGGLVTRADMAQHIFALLDLALDEIYIDDLPRSVDGDDAGRIELNDDDGTRNGQRVDDYFGDARRTVPAHVDDVIGAVYELGITKGTNNRVGEFGTFEPEGNVTRAQMASFLMRALGHTNLRPARLTAQSTNDETQVSVRDADFEPVVNARVELFSANYAANAFTNGGQCIDRYVHVDAANPGFEACEIDGGDSRTDIDGNAELQPGLGGGPAVVVCTTGTPYDKQDNPSYRLQATGLSDPDADFKLWAWTGAFGDTVDDDTDLVEAVPANVLNPRTRAVTAVFSGGTDPSMVRMGSTLNFAIQLVDSKGRPVGPNPAGDVDSAQDFIVTVEKEPLNGGRKTVSVTQMSPDDDGKITIVVTNPDPVIGTNNADVRVTVTAEKAAGNRFRFVDTTGAADEWDSGEDMRDATEATLRDGDPHRETLMRPDGLGGLEADPKYDEPRLVGATAPQQTFSDDPPFAAVNIFAGRTWRKLSSNLNRNTVSVTVLDQYGNPYRSGAIVGVTFGSRTEDPDEDTRGDSGTSDRGGRVHFSYNYGLRDDAATAEMITITPSTEPAIATVYWANIGPRGEGTKMLLLPDPSSSTLIVDQRPTGVAEVFPVAYLFGADDEFVVGLTGTVGTSPQLSEPARLSLEQFLEVLMVAISSDPAIGIYTGEDGASTATLEWVGFNNNRPNDGATWMLTGLDCQPPPGADREPALAEPAP